MSTKFGNLDDLFEFMEIKRDQIEEYYRIQMTTDEFEQEFNSNTNNTVNSENLDHNTKLEDPSNTTAESIKQMYDILIEDIDTGIPVNSQSENIQMAWSTSLETPKVQKRIESFLEADKYDFDVESSPPKFIEDEKINTTLIMEHLNLDNGDFDDVISCYSNESVIIEPEEKKLSPKDPFELLSFPMSQFPVDFFAFTNKEEEESRNIEKIDDHFIEENDIDTFLFDSDLIELKNDIDHSHLDLDLDIPFSQFPNTQMIMKSNLDSIESSFLGFSTGRGKKLPPPSDDSIRKALKIIDFTDNFEFNEVEEEIDDTKEEEPILAGFSTGHGKALPTTSKEAMKRARNLLELDGKEDAFQDSVKFNSPSDESIIKRSRSSIDDFNVSNSQGFKDSTVGFSTAKGVTLPKPSKAALERAQQIMTDPIQHEVSETFDLPTLSFSTGKGVILPPPSKEALKRATELIFSNDYENSESENSTDNVFVGFSTGKGKLVPTPSEESMSRAKLLIEKDVNKLSSATKSSFPTKITSSLSFHNTKKPFSLSNAWKRTRKPVKLSSKAPESVKIKTEPIKLFDLNTVGIKRHNLKEFFQKSPNLKIESSDYEKIGINHEILKMNSWNAKDFKFPCGWGSDEAYESLILSGASRSCIDQTWTCNHYRWIIWKFVSLIRTFPELYCTSNLTPSWVLSQLLYRYEREINQCHRSSLKKIVERDDAAGKYLCLVVARIDGERRRIELSDGWYSIWTSSLDYSFWSLIENSKISEGVKIELYGASLTGQDALPILDASSVDCLCNLVICRNSCRPAKWDTKLGFMTNPKERVITFLKNLNQVHPQGGPIPALKVIVDRVYPLLFKEERQENNGAHPITRNERDHFTYLESNPEQAQTSKFSPIQRVRLSNTQGNSAIVSFWNLLGEDQNQLLQEGSSVIITNLRASKNSRMSTNNNLLSLISSKSTRLFKDDSKPIDPLQLQPPPFKIIKEFSMLTELKFHDTVDLIGGIFLGRCGNYFWIGPSDQFIDILVCLKNFNLNISFSPGDVINFRDLSFNHFDGREGVVHFNFTEYSDFKKEPRSLLDFKRSQDRFNELTK